MMNRLIDYAGLFPPAKLDMASTVRNYADYSACADSWMLGRLIVPVARLEEFEQHAAAFLPQAKERGIWQVSALASAAGSASLAGELQQIDSFNQQHESPAAGRVIVDVVELKADSTESVNAAMDLMPEGLFAFFELPIDRDPAELIECIGSREAGAKVRTGGETSDAYPSTAHLARFIAACAASGVPFKATAGMHHPLRHRSEANGAMEFGFLNVFMAAGLALTDELDETAIARLLEETSQEAFQFASAAASWGEFEIAAESIEDIREEFAMSFGSCSFDEPRQDLRAMGLL
jgi:hypothetical protein